MSHPVWRVWPRVENELDVDTGLLHGPAFAALARTRPLSVIAAEGSEVSVFPGRGLGAPELAAAG